MSNEWCLKYKRMSLCDRVTQIHYFRVNLMSVPPFGAKDVLRITILYINILPSGKEIDSSEYILSDLLREGGTEGGKENELV